MIAGVLAALAVLSVVTGLRLLGRDPEVRAVDVGAVPTAVETTRPSAARPSPTRASAAGPRPAARPTATGTPPAPATGTPPAPATGTPPAPPVRLRIPTARIAAPLVAIGVRRDGELDVPDAPRVVGWWVGSAPAGSPRDATVLAGHVDSDRAGVGALAALPTLGAGARIELVDTFRGVHAYRVVARRTYPKYALPRDVFRVGGQRRLVLITCGGPFDERAGRYRDNVVVYAVPTS